MSAPHRPLPQMMASIGGTAPWLDPLAAAEQRAEAVCHTRTWTDAMEQEA